MFHMDEEANKAEDAAVLEYSIIYKSLDKVQ